MGVPRGQENRIWDQVTSKSAEYRMSMIEQEVKPTANNRFPQGTPGQLANLSLHPTVESMVKVAVLSAVLPLVALEMCPKMFALGFAKHL